MEIKEAIAIALIRALISALKILLLKVAMMSATEIASNEYLMPILASIKKEKIASIIHSIKLNGLFSNNFISNILVINYLAVFNSLPLGTTKLNPFLTTLKSIDFAPLISPSMQMGTGFSNSILKCDSLL